MKKLPLKPATIKQPKNAIGQAKKAKQEIIPVADQILILKARLLQIQIIMNNIENDQELYEKRRKVYGSVEKLVGLDEKVNEYFKLINQKTAYENSKKMIDQFKILINHSSGGNTRTVNPFDQFRLDYQKYEQHLLKTAQQVHLKDCEANQTVLVKSIEQAVVKCQSLIKDLELAHKVDREALDIIRDKSVQDLAVIKGIDAQNQEIWTEASHKLDLLYMRISARLLNEI